MYHYLEFVVLLETPLLSVSMVFHQCHLLSKIAFINLEVVLNEMVTLALEQIVFLQL